MKIQNENKFILNIGLGDTKTRVYQLIYNEKESNHTKIIQNSIIHRLGL